MGLASESVYSGPGNTFYIESLRDTSSKDGQAQPALTARRPASASGAFRRARAETFSFFPSKLLPEDAVAPMESVLTNAADMPPAVPTARHRSGSLSLPRSNISGAFGPSLFATSWQPANILNGLDRPGHSDYGSSAGNEDETTAVARTLDYLGLDDPLHENRQHASNAYQSLARNPPLGAPLGSSYGSRGRSYSVAVGETMSMNLPPVSTYRPRATSIAFLESTVDSDIEAIRRSLAQGDMELRMDSPASDMDDADLVGNLGRTTRSAKSANISRSQYNVLAQTSPKDYMAYGVERGLAGSPTRHADFPHPHQIPTRSLWIGNIDPTLSPSDLLTLFSPFGPMESLRILPDKECAFVNYIHVEDAIRAREDMQGGRVGNCIVRIGFGKAEAINDTQGMQPTKSLWVGNIPPTTDPAELEALFAAYGTVESARVLTHKNCGFVNFIRLEDAMDARKSMNGKEIGGSVVKIGYAKVPPRGTDQASASQLVGIVNGFTGSPSRERSLSNGESSAYGSFAGASATYSPGRTSDTSQSAYAPETSTTSGTPRFSAPAYSNDQALAMAMAGSRASPRRESVNAADQVDATWNGPSVGESYAPAVPPVPEPKPNRRVDQVRLRELRKRLETHVTAKDVEAFFNEVVDETVDLCTDYIGNVVIQKIIEKASDQHRLRLIEKVAPHMAAIGIHKNGTWVVQKMIDYAKTTSQIQVIVNALKPFTPPLLLDQFGNYVVQCCLRLGTHRNQFVFEAMHAKCYEVGQGRFGARAMRACLEGQYTTKRQQKFVAEAIVHNIIQLATNPNGAILVTWLLDTSNLPGRYQAMAPKLCAQMTALCTHKLASATILKLVNQRVELEARELVINEMFYREHEQAGQPSTLQVILADQIHGVSVIQKILASACVSSDEKIRLADRVRIVLSRMSELRDNHMSYKRLLDELMVIPTSLAPDGPGSDVGLRLGAGAHNDEIVSPLVPQQPGFVYMPPTVPGAQRQQQLGYQQGRQGPQHNGGWYAPAQLPTPSNSPQPGMFQGGQQAYPGGGMYPSQQHYGPPHSTSTPPPVMHQPQQQFGGNFAGGNGSYPPSPQHPAPFVQPHYQQQQQHGYANGGADGGQHYVQHPLHQQHQQQHTHHHAHHQQQQQQQQQQHRQHHLHQHQYLTSPAAAAPIPPASSSSSPSAKPPTGN
ncbi:hypothetical protein HKX48_001170 [Thoreauomyces humboldtii]|nr:hypothetical protein HKX48_001170 [Thoreauomyces humboldtii]